MAPVPGQAKVGVYAGIVEFCVQVDGNLKCRVPVNGAMPEIPVFCRGTHPITDKIHRIHQPDSFGKGGIHFGGRIFRCPAQAKAGKVGVTAGTIAKLMVFGGGRGNQNAGLIKSGGRFERCLPRDVVKIDGKINIQHEFTGSAAPILVELDAGFRGDFKRRIPRFLGGAQDKTF